MLVIRRERLERTPLTPLTLREEFFCRTGTTHENAADSRITPIPIYFLQTNMSGMEMMKLWIDVDAAPRDVKEIV
jgi:hypothetical protein